MITLTSGPAFVTALTLSAYTADRDGGPITHAVLGRRQLDVTVRPLGMRRGRFTLDFATLLLSDSAFYLLGAARVWTLTHTDVPTLNMEFVITGVTQDVNGSGRWPVTVSFEEIS